MHASMHSLKIKTEEIKKKEFYVFISIKTKKNK